MLANDPLEGGREEVEVTGAVRLGRRKPAVDKEGPGSQRAVEADGREGGFWSQTLRLPCPVSGSL